LPRTDSAAPVAPVAAGSSAPAASHGTILVLEDEASLRGLVARVLAGQGYNVIVAGTAAEALACLEKPEVNVDLLLTDVVLPGRVQGNEFAVAFATRLPDCPVLFMSGYPRDTFLRSGRLDDGVCLLEKPFAPGQLISAVAEALGIANRPAGSRP
jgi:two-component system cell cycle sensor histidine kinase/response regulator CckA